MANPITPEQLRALADAPGFGMAQKALKAAGHWDEHAASDGKRMKFSVKIVAQAEATAHVTVEARSAKEAEAKADEMLNDNRAFSRINWEYGDLDDFDFPDEPKIIGECDDD